MLSLVSSEGVLGVAVWAQVSLQSAATGLMSSLTSFYTLVMVWDLIIVCVVGGVMLAVIMSPYTSRTLLEHKKLETLWTIFPMVILGSLALPSLHLLYVSDLVINPAVTLKSIGHQWYWSYEYDDFERKLAFNSYMKAVGDMQSGSFRLLEVDNRAVLPYGVEVKNLITSGDVIHSWAVPSFGVKVDGVPGRTNQIGIQCFRPGVFYGQCSEICGANHGFMPIVVEMIPWADFIKWFMAHSEPRMGF